MSPDARWQEIAGLRGRRPRSRLVRATTGVFLLLVLLAWCGGDLSITELFEPRRWENLVRFLTHDAVPAPLRNQPFSWSVAFGWVGTVLVERGGAAALETLWISVLAIVLAGVFAALIAPLGARTLFDDDPYLSAPSPAQRSRRRPGRRSPTALVPRMQRLGCVALRSIPEFIWAFLLLAMLGPNAWPIVIALAVHNAGILGRLFGDTLENLDAAPMRSLRMLGASRAQIAWTALRPLALPRFLLFFFYRYETCVREATVLGMLGATSLGYWIQEARARQRYDELLLYVALGVGLVLLGELASRIARAWVR